MSLEFLPFSFFASEVKKWKLRYEEPTEETLAFLAAAVSEEYADFIRTEGFSTYKNSLYTTVDPLKYREVVLAYELNPETDIPIVKSAFGDLFYFDGYSIKTLYTSHNERYTLCEGDAVKYFFVFTLLDSDFHKDLLRRKTLFKKSLDQFGQLNGDESYAFTEPLHSGGREVLENIGVRSTTAYLEELGKAFQSD